MDDILKECKNQTQAYTHRPDGYPAMSQQASNLFLQFSVSKTQAGFQLHKEN